MEGVSLPTQSHPHQAGVKIALNALDLEVHLSVYRAEPARRCPFEALLGATQVARPPNCPHEAHALSMS